MAVTTVESKISYIFKNEVDKQKLSQKEMAEDIFVTPQLMSHMLTGKRNIGLERMVEIADYISSPNVDFELSNLLLGTPLPTKKPRRDNHPLSKMVGQGKEERERLEVEKKFEIWDLLAVSNSDLLPEEREEIKKWLVEFTEEICSELAVLVSVCDRYGINLREIVKEIVSKQGGD